ncbi:hypothetical protein EV286_101229 [Rhizobium sp. BK251]|nr:hypothetical protein EV286_101229 [Rhizobium sp. BK251]
MTSHMDLDRIQLLRDLQDHQRKITAGLPRTQYDPKTQRIRELEAALRDVKEALEPFASEGSRMAEALAGVPDDTRPLRGFDITIGDLRRAVLAFRKASERDV